MKKVNLINFLKEERQEEKYFKCTMIILIYLLVFQSYFKIQSINNLNEEISKTKLIVQSQVESKHENKKSTLIKDIKKVYDLLGFSNIENLSIENNKVSVEGKCKDLKILEELKSMDDIKNFAIGSVENKNKKFYFYVTYEIGGVE